MVLTTGGSKSTSDLPPQAVAGATVTKGKSGGSGAVVTRIVKASKGKR